MLSTNKGPIKQSQHLPQHSHNICCDMLLPYPVKRPQQHNKINVVTMLRQSLNEFKLVITPHNIVRLLLRGVVKRSQHRRSTNVVRNSEFILEDGKLVSDEIPSNMN